MASMPSLIAFLTNDLVFPSRLAAVAQKLGVRMEVATNHDVLLAKLAAETSSAAVVILDLGLPGITPAALLPQLKASFATLTIIAFGPHVHEQKLADAKAAGCDVVLTRGQFDAQIQSLLAQILSPSK
jgi:CheY-like chemotaxis protein